MDTIFALSTAWGKAGVAIVRLSGPGALRAAEDLAGSLPPARTAGLRKLSGEDGAVLDEGLVLWFPDGASYTGEPVVELHIHGGRATAAAVLNALGAKEGLRLAEAGEFTLRALRNGRMDLPKVEGLADLIEAETEAQRKQAMRTFSGELGRKADSWSAKMLRCQALLEAAIDFSDEEIPHAAVDEAKALAEGLAAELRAEIRGAEFAERVRDGFEVAIVGPPNVGKSTLLNFISRREAAIVSEHEGTTRDVIEVRMDLSGLPVTLLDTAGLRESADPVEGIGVDRARQRADAADLRIFLAEGGEAEELPVRMRPGDCRVRAKADLSPGIREPAVSGKTGQGVESLLDRVRSELAGRAAAAGTATRQRHRAAMESAVSALESCRHELNANDRNLEIAAEELRAGARSLGALIGKIETEEVLGEIFASFCVGK